MRPRLLALTTLVGVVLGLTAGPTWACGGLVNPNGSVTLVRTTTLAAYVDGVEHYVTSFEFAGAGGEFGSIVPLPGVPTKVVRGGDWTLQRLVLETQPLVVPGLAFAALAAEDAEARVLLRTRIDALDVTVLEGGGRAVGDWAREHGFLLPPDAPEVLDFYARRSPIFMAVTFNAERAEEQGIARGQGTPVHVAIPTPNPWVPLRILGLGAPAAAPVEADVYLLTEREPALLPAPVPASLLGSARGRVALLDREHPGLVLERSEPASSSLLADLRSDRGMGWLPTKGMWLTYLRVDSRAGALTYDLAVDASGAGRPSPVAAGLDPEAAPGPGPGWLSGAWAVALLGAGLAAGVALARR
ncbi:MAG TPA: DUF2330 domain-containing protein, partial [Actinomycetota bacterium]|nr:DUF2330 domain-containing protein [Actinomycetota bacterium]